MKQSTLIILVALGLLFFYGCNKYNSIIPAQNNVDEKWAKVQSQYQRRADLIPNIVESVKGEANFEKGVLEGVINARASATKMTVNASDLTPEKLKQFQDAQGQIGSALGRLLSVSEQYPNLKANQAFQDLRSELAGTENRVSVARNDYNSAVKDYDNTVQTFPNNILTKFFGFKEKPYYQADAGTEKAPNLKGTFDNMGGVPATK